jgi:hypothetical protein
LQDPSHPIRPSENLRDRGDIKECIVQSGDVQKILNLLLALVHTPLYESATACNSAIFENSPDQYVCSLWKSVFHGISIISNGTTKLHRDTKGHIPWYDFLVSIGNAEDLYLDLPELRTSLYYKPRTVVALAGHAIGHRMEAWEEGRERACWAFFLRKNLFDKFSVPVPSWSLESSYDVEST